MNPSLDTTGSPAPHTAVTRPQPGATIERAPHPFLELEHVSQEYRTGDRVVRALDGVSLEIRRGELVAVVGPSGSGKTTLLQILGCLDVPTAGRYTLDGVRTDELDDDALSRVRNEKIGFVFQTFNLIPRTTALENVETPLLYADRPVGTGRADAVALLERVGLAGRLDHFPTELSGGEQQRVAIARALIMRPVLLLADEPTGNLDRATGDQIMTLLQSLHREGLTVVMVTHDPTLAVRAERVVALEDGRLVPTAPATLDTTLDATRPAATPHPLSSPSSAPSNAPSTRRMPQ